MNIIFATLQEIQSAKWYGVSKDIEVAKGKNEIGNFGHKIKRRFYYFLLKNKHQLNG